VSPSHIIILALAMISFSLVGCRHLACSSSTENPAPREIASNEPQVLLAHTVTTPSEFASGRPWPSAVGFPAERYIQAYENAWWRCVEDFARDIDRHATIGDRAGNGWPSAVRGYWDGYCAAEQRVASIVEQFGKVRAQQILRQGLKEQEM
jgi:hypothetical protein